jgi:uncharacterized protein
MDVELIPITDMPNKWIIYRPRTGLAFIGNHVMADLIRQIVTDSTHSESLPEQIAHFLNSVGFFTPDPPPPDNDFGAFRPRTAVLLMTNQCQLRCTYCYAAAGESNPQELTTELGFAAIDHVYQNAVEQGVSQFEVSFHGGGEPTFNWKTLVACAEYARQKPLRARLSLTSNGIWSRKQVQWVVNNLDGLSLSLDGSPATQDHHRPFMSGKGSSKWVMRTVEELDYHEFSYGIRMTATAPWEQLPEDVRFLCENTKCSSMQVEPAFNTTRGGHGDYRDDESSAFIAAYMEAFDIAERAGRFLHYSGARVGTITPTFCTAPVNALIVNGEGSLVTCYEVASPAHALSRISTIGKVENQQVRVDKPARDNLVNLMSERRDACKDCFCYWSCAGDCYARVFRDEPGGHQIRGTRCKINRSLTEQLLLRRIADSGGVWNKSVRSQRVAQTDSVITI